MNKLWRQLAIATNWPILAAIAVLCAMGIVSIWAHSTADPKDAADVKKQIVFLGIGIAVLFGMQTFSYLRIGRFAWAFYILSLVLIVYTILPGVPRSGFFSVPLNKTQTNWINFGPMNLQPAELAKVSFCMVLARYLRFRSNYRTLVGLVPPFLLAIVPLALILKQPDLGTALVFIPALFAMLFVAGAKKRHLLAVVGMALATGPVFWLSGKHVLDTGEQGPAEVCLSCSNLPLLNRLPQFVKHYQRERVYAMFSNDPRILRKEGYQQDRAATAFGSGGPTGQGAGNIPVGRTVPEAHNDMIFALIGEQFGFIGAAVLLGAYLVMFTTGLEISSGTREPFGKLLAVGIVSLLAGQAFLNLMVALRLMPVTGVTLPFVSYGGSSLLASFIAAGLLLNIGQNRPIVMAGDAFEFD